MGWTITTAAPRYLRYRRCLVFSSFTKTKNGGKRSHYNITTLQRRYDVWYAMVGRRIYLLYTSIILFTTLYYVNHLYILHLYLRCIHRCIHRGLYRSRYWQAATHSVLSLLKQYETCFDNGQQEPSLLLGSNFRMITVLISESLLDRETIEGQYFFASTITSEITLIHVLLPRPLTWHTLVRKKISTSTVLRGIISNVLCHLYYVVFCSGGLYQSWYWQAASQSRLSGYLRARRRHPQRLSWYLRARRRHSFLTSTKQVLNKCLSTRIKTR